MNLNEVAHDLGEFSFKLTIMLLEIDDEERRQNLLEAIKMVNSARHVVKMFNECSFLTLQEELALEDICKN